MRIKRILIVTIVIAILAVLPVFAQETEQKLCPLLIPEQGVMWKGTEWNGADRGNYPNRNCDIVSIGREPARVDSIPYTDAESARLSALNYEKERSSFYLLLSQTDWKFYWLENPEEFRVSDVTEFYEPRFDDSDWDTIFVPSVWQTQGYDHSIYTNSTQKFARNFGNDEIGYPRDLPKAPTYYNPVGLYRYEFEIPKEWEGQRIYIDLEGVDSAFYLWINGIQTGYAEDSFTTNEFDITDYVRFGEVNTLAAKVFRWCDGSWLEDQDFYDLSGIFRDVYVYAAPQVRVRDFSIVTDFDETFTDALLEVDVFLHNYNDVPAQAELELSLLEADGSQVALDEAAGVSNDDPANGLMTTSSFWNGSLEPGEEQTVSFRIPIKEPRKWSAEDPYLYTLLIREQSNVQQEMLQDSANEEPEEQQSIADIGGEVWESAQVGFRKITYKNTDSGWYEDGPTDWDLIRINGQPIMFRGVDRHETHPELGYAITREVMEEDIRIMLENNINAVRTSHYPNQNYWYYLCDKYGIYVVDEANVECHSNMLYENERLTEYLSRAIIDREYNMIRRDRNHASVVMWSLGNENKNPQILRTILVEPYEDPEGTERILHEYTKDRPWHYEQAGTMYETGIDVRSGMYALPQELEEHGKEDGPVPMIECEYEHAMGNSEGNFDEYWYLYDNYRNLQGGFIWDYIDQSIYLENDEGELYFGFGGDYGETIHDSNFCANGLLLPDRTLQPEMAEVRYFYQQLRFRDVDAANGQIEIQNYYLFTDIPQQYEIRWELLENNTVIQEGIVEEEQLHIPCVDSLTGQPGSVVIQLPFSLQEQGIRSGCEYFLNISAVLKEDTGMLPAGHAVAIEQFELNTGTNAEVVMEANAEAAIEANTEAFIEASTEAAIETHTEAAIEASTEAAMETLTESGEKQENSTEYEENQQLPTESGESLQVTENENVITITGEDFTAAFDYNLGRMVQYTAGEKELIIPGEGPAGSFFRAGTDNDRGMGASLQVFTLPWKDPGMYVVSEFTVEYANSAFGDSTDETGNMGKTGENADEAESKNGAGQSADDTGSANEAEQSADKKAVIITVKGSYPNLNNFVLETVYQIRPDGSISVNVTMLPQYDERLVYIPVAGVQLTVPGEYEQMTWFGRGPEENYQDRKQGTKVGVYQTTVTDNFTPYVMSSETGNHTDVRWIALTDAEGYGLLACAGDIRLETSALHYTAEELDRAVHPYELQELEDTILRLNYVQIGVGGDNSWDRIVPHEQYLPHAEIYQYSFTLIPLTPQADPMELYEECSL